MIPKIIHFVWLSDEKKPVIIEKCIESWKRHCPDYEIKLWTLKNIPQHHWIDETVKLRKWAFATDYIRTYALYKEGGIYLDSDVFLKGNLDKYLNNKFFSAIEWNRDFFVGTNQKDFIDNEGNLFDKNHCVAGLNINAAIFGCEAGHSLLEKILEFYDNNHFVFEEKLDSKFLAPIVYSKAAESFGFKYLLKEQNFGEDCQLYLNTEFASNMASAKINSVAIHLCTSMWREYNWFQKIVWKLKIKVKSILMLR